MKLRSKITLIIALTLTITTSTGAYYKYKQANKDKMKFTNTQANENLNSTNLIKTLSKEADKINPNMITIKQINAINNSISLMFGDTKGAKVTIKALNTNTDDEVLQSNIEGDQQVLLDNLAKGRWFVYIIGVEYADGTTSDEVSLIKPLQIGVVNVTGSENLEPPNEEDANGDIVTNRAIKNPILRYDSSKSIVDQTSEIIKITSTSITISPYKYSKNDVESVQYYIKDATQKTETDSYPFSQIAKHTFENLRPNTEYTIGYRVLNSSKTLESGTKIQGEWSDYTTVKVYTNASKNLVAMQGEINNNLLELKIHENVNYSLPCYKVKVLHSSITPAQAQFTDSMKIKSKTGQDITGQLIRLNAVYAEGLKPGETYHVYVTDVEGLNKQLVTTIPGSSDNSDTKITLIGTATITTNDADSNSVADKILELQGNNLPQEIANLSKSKLKDIFNEVAKTDRKRAATLYIKYVGIDNVVTNYTKDFDISKYTRLDSTTYMTTVGYLECIEYIEYKQIESQPVFKLQ